MQLFLHLHHSHTLLVICCVFEAVLSLTSLGFSPVIRASPYLDVPQTSYVVKQGQLVLPVKKPHYKKLLLIFRCTSAAIW